MWFLLLLLLLLLLLFEFWKEIFFMGKGVYIIILGNQFELQKTDSSLLDEYSIRVCMYVTGERIKSRETVML